VKNLPRETHLSPVTAIICTRDRPQNILRCLDAVIACPELIEIIVVDQSASDETERLVSGVHDIRVRYRRDTGLGVSRARNIAAIMAHGDLLAFTDDDCAVSIDWARSAIAAFGDDLTVGIATGAVLAAAHNASEEFIPSYAPRRRRQQTNLRNARALGANMVVRRAAFDAAGGFDESLGEGGRFHAGEDTDLLVRVIRAGFEAVTEPSMAVCHWGARNYADGSASRLLRRYNHGEGLVLAKRSRTGDKLALPVLATAIASRAVSAVLASIRKGRITDVNRTVYLIRGFVAGLRPPIDPVTHTFLATDGHAVEASGADEVPIARESEA